MGWKLSVTLTGKTKPKMAGEKVELKGRVR